MRGFSIVVLLIVASTLLSKDRFKNQNIEVKFSPKKFDKIKVKYETVIKLKKNYRYNTDLWEVISDRNENPVYSNPSKNSKVIRKINYLEKYLVGAVEGEFVFLVKDSFSLVKKEVEFTKNAKKIGWVKIRNLIVSDNSLINEKGIDKKGMVINGIDNIGNVVERNDLNKLTCRPGPGENYEISNVSIVFKLWCYFFYEVWVFSYFLFSIPLHY